MESKVVIGIVIYEGKVLIVRRKQKEGNLYWQFPGGEIEDGETVDNAVAREIKEETGIICKPIICLGSRIHPSTQKAMTYWACDYISGDVCISDDDLDAACWININEVISYFTTPVFPPILEYLGLNN